MKKASVVKAVAIDIRRYGGRQVVIYRNRIVSSGGTAHEAIRKAQTKYPRAATSELRVFAVPETVHTVYVFS